MLVFSLYGSSIGSRKDVSNVVNHGNIPRLKTQGRKEWRLDGNSGRPFNDGDHEQGKDEPWSKNTNGSGSSDDVGEHHGVVGVDSGILGLNCQQARVSGDHVLGLLLSKNFGPDLKGGGEVVLVKPQAKGKGLNHFDCSFSSVHRSESVEGSSDILFLHVRDSSSGLLVFGHDLGAINIRLWDSDSGDGIEDIVLSGGLSIGVLASIDLDGFLGQGRVCGGSLLEKSIGACDEAGKEECDRETVLHGVYS